MLHLVINKSAWLYTHNCSVEHKDRNINFIRDSKELDENVENYDDLDE